MTRTEAIAFPVTLYVAWYVQVVGRAGNGPGLQWSRIPVDARLTALATAVLYAVFVVVALLVLYVTRVRGHPVSARAVLVPALARLAAVYVVALVAGVALGEAYCVADERAFRRETRAHLAVAVPDPVTHEMPLYARVRWWPGDAQQLVSPMPGER